ncbi:hypothetical protein YC2023_004518 [Brassica napus]
MVVWTFKGTFPYIFSTQSRLRRVTREFFRRDSRSLLGTRRFNGRILGSNGTLVLLQNPEMLLGPEGRFWSPEAALDPKIALEPGG